VWCNAVDAGRGASVDLWEVDGIDIGSPKAAARASLQTGLLSDEQARSALLMSENRNLTVPTYEEQLADEIAGRVPGHTRLLTTIPRGKSGFNAETSWLWSVGWKYSA
jgi:hypothetical protein